LRFYTKSASKKPLLSFLLKPFHRKLLYRNSSLILRRVSEQDLVSVPLKSKPKPQKEKEKKDKKDKIPSSIQPEVVIRVVGK
jgi:hypothetical protein